MAINLEVCINYHIFAPKIRKKNNMEATKNTSNKYSRLADAYSYMESQGWEPMKASEREECHQMVADYTNL